MRIADERPPGLPHRLRHVITNVVGGPSPGVNVEAHVRSSRMREVAAKKLLAQANDTGGRDNITLVIVRFDQDDSGGRLSMTGKGSTRVTF